jgi:hypothetical protein
MKTLLLTLSLLVANAAYAADFYECEGFAGVDEYRAGISLSKKKAGFFENDATSYMALKSMMVLESHPPQVQYTFEGKEASYDGTLRLIFNETRLHATILTIDGQGKAEVLGEASCRAEAREWDMEEGE